MDLSPVAHGRCHRFGLGVDFLLPRELFTSLLSPTDACCHMSTPWWQWASTVVMGALLLYALVIAPLLHRRTPETAEAAAAENGTAPRRFVVEGMTCHHCCTHVEKPCRVCRVWRTPR